MDVFGGSDETSNSSNLARVRGVRHPDMPCPVIKSPRYFNELLLTNLAGTMQMGGYLT
jgi:hypothetical protein